MTKTFLQDDLSRRSFLKRLSSVAATSAMTSNALSLAFLAKARGRITEANDYRALVFVFLNGGNDAFNMVVPSGSGQLRANYEAHRGVVALSNDVLNPLNLLNPAKVYGDSLHNDFGLHSNCHQLAAMFNNQEMAVMCNIGNLLQPLTREEYYQTPRPAGTVPPELFSHSDQQRQFQSEPNGLFSHGWGGRLAEHLTRFNLSAEVSPLMSTAGLNPFQVTRDGTINPYGLATDGLIDLKGFTGRRSDMVNGAMDANLGRGHLMAQKYTDVFFSAQNAQEILKDSFDIAESSGVDFDDIFNAAGASASSKIANSLKTVAKVINGRQATINTRPIFFVEMAGFDTHADMLPNHNELMSELDSALKGFRDVLVEQGDFDNVLTYVGSEFARTLTPNGNDPESSGTDHAWGGHALAIGGMVDGGKFFGTHPDLVLNDHLDLGGRGRFIPTHSASQCSAVVANWMGSSQEETLDIFPSLSNFDNPFDPLTNINFIKS